MNKLTEVEILEYTKESNYNTGVKGITRKDLESIDLDKVPEIIKDFDTIKDLEGNNKFKFDRFTPRAGSIYFKPSFAGRQVLMGRIGRILYFSNGRWFSIA